MEFDKILRTYIEHLLKLQEEHQNTPLTLDELDRLHQELGLTPQELDFIDKKFQDYHHRGLGFFRYQDWDRAIQELEQALILKPLHMEVLDLLAEAYMNRSRKKHSPKDHQKALYYAERCLQSDPRNERALYLIAQLRRGSHTRHRTQHLLKVFIGLMMAILLAFSAYLLGKMYFEPIPAQEQQPALHKQEVSATQIPVFIRDENASRGFEVAVESSFIERDADKAFYHIRACLINKKYDLSELEIRLILKNKAHRRIQDIKIDLLNTDQPELLAGDALPWIQIVALDDPDSAPVEAEIVIETSKQEPTKYNPDDALTLLLQWESGSSRDLILKERRQVILPHPDDFEHEITFEFINQKDVPIYIWKVQVNWFDKSMRQVHSTLLDLVDSNAPSLSPGQRRRISFKQLIPIKVDDYEEYLVEVIECVDEASLKKGGN
ncbi:MAG: hypothetical protein NW226_09580 [Microscillaceae bacterium]|nr:hypothetical protein [Microscillaceae bacterium]